MTGVIPMGRTIFSKFINNIYQIYYGFLKNLSDSNGYNTVSGTFTIYNSYG